MELVVDPKERGAFGESKGGSYKEEEFVREAKDGHCGDTELQLIEAGGFGDGCMSWWGTCDLGSFRAACWSLM